MMMLPSSSIVGSPYRGIVRSAMSIELSIFSSPWRMSSPASRMSRATRSRSGQAGWSLAAAATPEPPRSRKTKRMRKTVMADASLVAQQRRRLGAERLPSTGKSYHKRKGGGEQRGARDDIGQEQPVGVH